MNNRKRCIRKARKPIKIKEPTKHEFDFHEFIGSLLVFLTFIWGFISYTNHYTFYFIPF